ncbi:MAG: DUF3488 and transglutaminase-like domain-containing protein [Aquincola sp.]|nr:DUF3488 and transglutaminase-like domain-containing protein [Aquincola sp.]
MITTLLPRWPGWTHLPRDARDVLFLLAVISWTIVPHFAHLPAWCLALTMIVMLWRARVAMANAPLPGRWTLWVVLAVAIGLTFWTYRTLLGKDAGVTLLVMLMVLKTLELRARRDALVVFFLGFFLVLTNFLYAQSLAVAAAMLVSVWGLLTALVLAHMPVGRPAIAQAGTVAAKAALLGAPIMLVLFMLFPRMAPLWAVPQEQLAKSGLSGSLRLGGVAELAVDDSIALRARFTGDGRPAAETLYWRGPALSRFDGREWSRLEPSALSVTQRSSQLEVSGAPISYEVTLEPSRLPMLPLLEATPAREGDAPQLASSLRAFLRPDGQWATERAITERLRFSARAYLAHRQGPFEDDASLRAYTDLPAGYNPRTLAWAAALQRRPDLADATPERFIQAVLEHIRSGFTYTLTPGAYGDDEGRHAVDEFWIDRREGFCEHFSAAFVVIMRALDVPARIVTGYQGADAVTQDGWTIVRNSHAHAWAEVWIAGKGWLRVDPTAAVAPERIRLSQPLRPQLGLVAGTLNAINPELLAELRGTWERVNNRWNQWVLHYSRDDQLDLLQRLGWRSPEWADLAYLLITLLSGGAFAGAAWAWWDRHHRSPWERLSARLARKLTLLGVDVLPHDAPRTLARRVREQFGARGESLAASLEALDAMRYGRAARDRPDRAWWSAFERAASMVSSR